MAGSYGGQPGQDWLLDYPQWRRLSLVLSAFLVVPALKREAGPVDISLSSERGGETQLVAAPHGRNLQLRLDSSGLPDGQVWVEIVDSNGNPITEQQALAHSNQVPIRVANLTSGFYALRISLKQGRPP